jgi:hypothetical protein
MLKLVVNNKSPYEGTYQIWYDGQTHAVDVEGTNPWDVVKLMQKHPQWWRDSRVVSVYVDTPRAMRIGDVFVDPVLEAWEVEEDGFRLTDRPAPVAEYVAREGIKSPSLEMLKDWVRGCLDAIEGQDRDVPGHPEFDIEAPDR